MSNYSIVLDEGKFESFLDLLPDLKENEQFYVTLLCRKKYNPAVVSNKTVLKRFTSSKERLLLKIRQLEVAVGAYTVDGLDGSLAVPEDSLALYISANPRDLRKATLKSIATLANSATNENFSANPHKQVLSIIQKTCGTKHFVTLDVDSKLDGKIHQIRDIIPASQSVVIETRGGYHVLVKKEFVATMGKEFQKIREMCDITGDMLVAVPGCCQGGFVPTVLS